MARAADDTFAPSALTSGFRCVIYQTRSKPSMPDYLNQKGTNMKCQVNRFSILIFALFLLATYAVGKPGPSLVLDIGHSRRRRGKKQKVLRETEMTAS